MESIRSTFLDTITAVRPVIASPQIAAHWDEPSALPEFSVSGLAGHLVRATGSVDAYLNRPAPEQEVPISAAAYYTMVLDADISSSMNVSIRQRGEEQAAGGQERLIAELDQLSARLRDRLPREPADRLLRVYGDLVLRLDDYLLTRIVELVVHADDLAVSVGIDLPALPPAALQIAITTLTDMARHRHGDLAVLRALSRRERDTLDALRVF
jgi:hypothetical protein